MQSHPSLDRRELIAKLTALTAAASPQAIQNRLREESPAPSRAALQNADVIVTHCEVNDKHGVGSLVRKLFAGYSNIISFRSATWYFGECDFGDVSICVDHPDTTRDAVFGKVLDALGEHTVGRVICVPYLPDDIRNAIAIATSFGAPLCTYMMDDQNVCADAIPDELMRELLDKSTLCLGISPELCAVYELKYGHKLWFLPPLVPSRLIQNRISSGSGDSATGVIIGNIWGQRWLEMLRQTVRNSGITLHWYCNGDFRWLPCDKSELPPDSIIPHQGPPLPDDRLVEILRHSAFVAVPSGILDDSDDRRFIAQLSLPSRIPYTLATSNTPLLVLGSPATGAARFVEQFGIGLAAPYNQQEFRSAVDRITKPDANLRMRRNALAVAGRFTDVGAVEWIWQSLAHGAPIDLRYQDMMPKDRLELSHLLAV